MQGVRLIISLMLITHGIVLGSQYQILDVCIQVKLDQSFRRGSIPADELEKYGRFGMVEAPPFDRYFSVSSALYGDYLDFKQSVEIKKNLLCKIPVMIKDDIKNTADDNEVALLKQYTFPKFIPNTFIEKLKTCQKDSRPFQHVIYKNKNNGNTKTLALRYWIGQAENKEKLLKPAMISLSKTISQENRTESFYASDYVIDLLNLLEFFAMIR
jgi:hypothetical protein